MKGRQRPQGRRLVMPQGRSIPRTPPARPSRPSRAGSGDQISPELAKAGGDLVSLWARIRDCEACGRACTQRAYGSGHPGAQVLLLAAQPTETDAGASCAMVEEAEPLIKAFEALGMPPSSLYAATAVRCGSRPASSEEVAACAPHLLVEIEAVRPQAVVAFGPLATEALITLDGLCGIFVPDEIPDGHPVRLRSDLLLLATEPLPQGLVQKEAKRRLWRDLRALRSMLEE